MPDLVNNFGCLVQSASEELVQCSTGEMVPRYFRARIDRPSTPYVIVLLIAIEPDGSAVCHTVGSSRREQTAGQHTWVHEVLANLPDMGLRQWVKYATGIMALQQATGTTSLMWPAIPNLDSDPAAVEPWSEGVATFNQQRTRRRQATTPSRLAEVGNHYRAALTTGRADPTVAVGEAMKVSRSHAARLVGQARKVGLLGPTQPGRAGEDKA